MGDSAPPPINASHSNLTLVGHIRLLRPRTQFTAGAIRDKCADAIDRGRRRPAGEEQGPGSAAGEQAGNVRHRIRGGK